MTGHKNTTYNWCFKLTETITSWLNTLSDAGRPGEIRFCRQGYLIEPSKRSGLGASCLAMKVAYQTGIWEELEGHVRDGWVDHVCSFQRKQSGYFEDPTLLKNADQNAGWLWFKKEDIAIRRAETRQAAAALLALGSKPLHPVAKIPDTPKDALNYLERLPWHNKPWGAGSQASHLVFFLKLNADAFNQAARLEELLPDLLHYLDELQDPVTGSWFRKQAPLNEQVNAAMKVLTIYRLLGRPFRWQERLIDLCLSVIDDRDACHSVDVLLNVSAAISGRTAPFHSILIAPT